MTGTPLSRPDGPRPPIRHVHLGLGSFFRAHQAWYSDRASDGSQWGIAAFSGSNPTVPAALQAQDGLYSLVSRGAEADEATVVRSVVAAYPGGDVAALIRLLADPAVAVVTLTVTEAGYRRGRHGGLDESDPELRRDLELLRAGWADEDAVPVTTAPGRLVAGLAARCRDDAGPVAVVPCDNLPDNGDVVRQVLAAIAERVKPALAAWVSESVSVVSTVVDRITPRLSAAAVAQLRQETGIDDRVPVLTEPFSEWVLAGDFPAGRPDWVSAGVVVTTDVGPYERRKLWLLNGAHSLLAYAGPHRGAATVAAAIRDDVLLEAVEQWWDEVTPWLGGASVPGASLDVGELAAYRAALLTRFDNPRLEHSLDQIAADGSQKLPVRVLPVVRAERGQGRLPSAAVGILAAWVIWLRDQNATMVDPRASELRAAATGPLGHAVRRCLAVLDPDLAEDAELIDAITERARRW